MPGFTSQYFEHPQIMEVVFKPDFTIEQWNDFDTFFLAQIEKGILNWDLNLREVEFIASMFLGMLVSLYTRVLAKGGHLRLILKKESKTAAVIYLSKLNIIIPVWEN